MPKHIVEKKYSDSLRVSNSSNVSGRKGPYSLRKIKQGQQLQIILFNKNASD